MSPEPQESSASLSDAPRSANLYRLALLTTCATFPLIFMGGLVTSHHAGMSVPDWPNSYHYNMFLFPPSHWVGGILYEHTHRLMGTVVGFCAIVLVLWAWGVAQSPQTRRSIIRNAGRLTLLTVITGVAVVLLQRHISQHLRALAIQSVVGLAGLDAVLIAACFARTREPRRWVRWLCASVLATVVFQGVLGGLRVVLVQLDLAIVHACIAQAFFCLCAYTALVTSRWWTDAPDLSKAHHGRGLVALGLLTVAIIYLQLIVGATMRHFDAGLAIPDLPLAYGKILPPTTADGLAAVNHLRAFQLNLDPVTLTQIWLHFGHRIGAVLVSLLVIAFAVQALRHREAPGLKIPAVILLALLIVQVTLGVLTVLLRKPADVASSHVAVGALVLVTSFVMFVQALRMYRWHVCTADLTQMTENERIKDIRVAVGPKVHSLVSK